MATDFYPLQPTADGAVLDYRQPPNLWLDPEWAALAQRALDRADARAMADDEDIDAWAEQLAEDVCNATD